MVSCGEVRGVIQHHKASSYQRLTTQQHTSILQRPPDTEACKRQGCSNDNAHTHTALFQSQLPCCIPLHVHVHGPPVTLSNAHYKVNHSLFPTPQVDAALESFNPGPKCCAAACKFGANLCGCDEGLTAIITSILEADTATYQKSEPLHAWTVAVAYGADVLYAVNAGGVKF